MKVEITPSVLNGEITPPASKSAAHRALIAAALSGKPCLIKGNLLGDDVNATLSCLVSLGAKTEKTAEGIIIQPIKKVPAKAELNVGASGSTLRFMVSVCASLGVETTFITSQRLASRPMGGLFETLNAHGIRTSVSPLSVSGKLIGKEYYIDAGVSSQYLTGLMLALPVVGGGKIVPQGETVSKNYLKITASILSDFGVSVAENGGTWEVSGKYRSPGEFTVESDWSSAGFFAVAGAKGNIKLNGLSASSAQGDKAVLDAIKLSGAIVKENEISAPKGRLKAFAFNVENCPDAAPILSVLAAMCEGKSTLSGTTRLKLKESDRSAEIVKMLAAFGIKATDYGDKIEIIGGKLTGNTLVLPDDHRIAMSASIAAANAEGKTVLVGAECVNKSYPTFFEDFVKAGGKINVLGV